MIKYRWKGCLISCWMKKTQLQESSSSLGRSCRSSLCPVRLHVHRLVGLPCRIFLSYGFHVVTRNNRDENGAMGNGVSLLEHRRNGEILEEAKVEQIATVMRSRRLEWFGHVKRRDETENIRAVVEMKMEGKRPRGRPKLTWKDAVRRDMEAWSNREQWATDRERWKSMCKTRYPRTGRRWRKVRNTRCPSVVFDVPGTGPLHLSNIADYI